MITIFGASGNTGGAAAAHLLKSGKKVRAVGRNRDKLAALTASGAEACVGDIENAGFVREALSGAEAAYLLIPPNVAADDFRAYQRRVVDSLVAGVQASKSVRHVVVLSSVGAHHSAGTGPIVAVHTLEELLKKIAPLNALFVRPGFFMENVLMGLGSIKAQGVYAGPMPADMAVPMIAAADIGSYAGRRLDKLDFTGKSAVHLNGPVAFTQTELVTTLGQTIGKPVKYVQVTLDEVEKGMLHAGLGPSVVSVFMEMYQGAFKGLLMPEPGGVVETVPTTFATFAKNVFAPAYGA